MKFFVHVGMFLILAWPSNAAKIINKEDPGKCDSGLSGTIVTINDKEGNERVLICLKRNNGYIWKELDDFPTLGEYFNPAKDCSNIAQRNRLAKNGFYWIKSPSLKDVTKVWCDLTTDGGGFMLIGYKDSPKSWTVPSNDSLVSPQGPAHWSSAFGDVNMLEFRIQVSTTNKFADTKADWLYRFIIPRPLKELLMSDKEGCTRHYPGIGHIEYVKDLLAGEIASRNYQCSRFGPSYPSSLGWNLMNTCLESPCKEGFAVIPGTSFQYDNFGGFSYSTNIARSGIIHNSTAFVGCDHGKCCACFGPKGAKGDFCSPGCKTINGGTVTNTVQAWFWIRSSIPKQPAWKKCMEYEVQMADGKSETRFIDETTGVSQKGSCVKKGVPNLLDGVAKVDDKAEMESLPKIQGLLSYRKDNAKLYVTNGQNWEALGNEKQDINLANRLHLEERKILNISQEFRHSNTELEDKVKVLEERFNQSLKELNLKGKSCKEIISNNPGVASGVYWINHQGVSGGKFQVYCDMETHGGGWTLVYSYTFTDYNSFSSTSNAVTPRPNWPASGANVPISTSPPLSESSRGAIDFNIWKDIGKEIMIKSNINHWIVCQPNGGSLVRKQDGPLSCQNIKNVATKCQGVAPTKINWNQYNNGPVLSKSNLYYYFDGSTSKNWPTHDPCGNGDLNERKGVLYPGGTIFIR